MAIIVTVQFTGDSDCADAVLRDHPDLAQTVRAAAEKHGMIRSTRYIGDDGEFMDIDEWESLEDRNAFLAEVRPHLVRWNELAGVSGMVSKVWRLGPPH
jgi:hypothetical protein